MGVEPVGQVGVSYLCVRVVRPGDGQVVAAALTPQTLDVKGRFPT